MAEYSILSVEDFKTMLANNTDMDIIDIRDPDAYAEDHVDGAMNINMQELAEYIQTANKSKPVVVYCYRGRSCKTAAALLGASGFEKVYSLAGGFTEFAES